MVFLKQFFEKVAIEKNQQTTKKHEKLPSMKIINPGFIFFRLTSLEKKVGRYKKFEEYLLRVIDVMPEGMLNFQKLYKICF